MAPQGWSPGPCCRATPQTLWTENFVLQKEKNNTIGFNFIQLTSVPEEGRGGVQFKMSLCENIMSIEDLSSTQDMWLMWQCSPELGSNVWPSFHSEILTGDPRVLRSSGTCREKEPLFSCCTRPSLILTVLIGSDSQPPECDEPYLIFQYDSKTSSNSFYIKWNRSMLLCYIKKGFAIQNWRSRD